MLTSGLGQISPLLDAGTTERRTLTVTEPFTTEVAT